VSKKDRENFSTASQRNEARKLRKKLDFFILYSRALEKKLELSQREVVRLKEILEDR
jgi:hypothetical protein